MRLGTTNSSGKVTALGLQLGRRDPGARQAREEEKGQLHTPRRAVGLGWRPLTKAANLFP